MTPQCTDRDLLALETILFLGAGGTQQLTGGANGQLSGTTFTAAGADFPEAGIQPGMVLTTYDPARGPAEGRACEIVAVRAATQLDVSVLRAAADAPSVAPYPGGTHFLIRTYQPQIQAVHDALMERLMRARAADRANVGSFLPSPQLRQALACGTLAAVFVSRAQDGTAADANWLKAEHYRREFERLSSSLQLTPESSDGLGGGVVAMGNVTLRRV
ncbi:MAG: hypothetical protein FWE88_02985 [Phycisphaerae bacterium]|nr:hypothetical protein [Phycisphaerae bacterium]